MCLSAWSYITVKRKASPTVTETIEARADPGLWADRLRVALLKLGCGCQHSPPGPQLPSQPRASPPSSQYQVILLGDRSTLVVWRHGTFLTTSSSLLILTAAICSRRHPCSWQSDVHGCPLSATVRFRWPDAALEQSAIRCHVSSNAHCFSESPQDTPLLKIISCITFNCFSVPISYTVDSSGLAVFT